MRQVGRAPAHCMLGVLLSTWLLSSTRERTRQELGRGEPVLRKRTMSDAWQAGQELDSQACAPAAGLGEGQLTLK